jgi:hypothetical protein
VLPVGAAELNAVRDETDPGNELEDGANREAHDSTVPNSILLRGAIVVVTVALIDLGQVIYGTSRGVGVPVAKKRASDNEQYDSDGEE